MSQEGRELLTFIRRGAVCYQAVEETGRQLEEAGFIRLRERDAWELLPGKKYYVTRNQSSLTAFCLPDGAPGRFMIGAAHSDSPSFRVKPGAEWESPCGYVRLLTEPYGGGIHESWLDRPLSVAGRVTVMSGSGVKNKLVCIDRDLMVIPRVAIHMWRGAEEPGKLNASRDLLPLWSSGAGAGSFRKVIAEAAGVSEEKILGTDLFLYNRTPGMLWGEEEEFVSAPRLDDLMCVFGLLRGFLAAAGEDESSGSPHTVAEKMSAGGSGGEESLPIPVLAVFDNEEVGSTTRQGADSTLLEDTLRRIALAQGKSEEEYLRMLAGSFAVSADNAHAVHPAHPELSDPVNQPRMNGGIVIKFNGRQKYCTDGSTEASFRLICRRAGITRLQTYTNRSDLPGGSTLGNISSRHVSVPSVDIGLAQLAMHSCYETAGTGDLADLIRVMKEFFRSPVTGCLPEE